jgi:hypothetical protein
MTAVVKTQSKFVISTGGLVGLRPGLRPTQGDEKSFRPATTLYRTVALSFVIPSEADLSRFAVERSAVPIYLAART